MVKKLMRRDDSTQQASEPVATLNGAATLFGFIATLWETAVGCLSLNGFFRRDNER
jgi:hypothetical protein